MLYGIIALLVLIVIVLLVKLNNAKTNCSTLKNEVAGSRITRSNLKDRNEKLVEEKAKLATEINTLNSKLSEASIKISKYESSNSRKAEFKPISTDLINGQIQIKEPKTNKLVSNATVNIKVVKDKIVSSYIMKRGEKVNVLIYTLQ